MKKILIVLCSFSVLPFLAEAKGGGGLAVKPNSKPGVFAPPLVPGGYNGPYKTDPAFKRKTPIHPIGGFTSAHSKNTEISRKATRAVNGISAQGNVAKDVGEVLLSVPDIRARAQIAGVSAKKTNIIVDSLIAAATQSVKWDPASRKNVVQYARALAKDGPRKLEKKVEEVETVCVL